MARLLLPTDKAAASGLYELARPVIKNAWPWMGDAPCTPADIERLMAEGYEGAITDAGDAVFLWRNLRPVARGPYKGQKASELMLALLAPALSSANFRKRGDELFQFWFTHQKSLGVEYAWTELPRALGGRGLAYLDGAGFIQRDDFETDELLPDGTILKAVSWSQYSCRIAEAGARVR